MAIWENAEIAAGYPLSYDTFSVFVTAYTLSVTAYAVPALPEGEPRGGLRPPVASKFPFGDLVAPPLRTLQNDIIPNCPKLSPIVLSLLDFVLTI